MDHSPLLVEDLWAVLVQDSVLLNPEYPDYLETICPEELYGCWSEHPFINKGRFATHVLDVRDLTLLLWSGPSWKLAEVRLRDTAGLIHRTQQLSNDPKWIALVQKTQAFDEANHKYHSAMATCGVDFSNINALYSLQERSIAAEAQAQQAAADLFGYNLDD